MKNNSKLINFILLFALIRMCLNLFALSNYGFQRDEMLHLALGDHLDWGFKEVPPMIAVVAKLGTLFFGKSVAAARIFTTLCSGFMVLLTGLITIELGGKRLAITLACLSITFSPAFLASGYLLQPVVFDQLWWVLSALLLLKYFNTKDAKYLYWLGAAIGLGLLTKYTMAFFTAALIVGVLLSKERSLLSSKGILIAVLIALIVFMPNIIWQLTHHFPLATHMRKLRESQLEYVKPSDFILQQLLVNGLAMLLWLPGLVYLLIAPKMASYRFLAIAYIFTFWLFIVLSGKSYYLFGAYPMLFAAGATGYANWLKAKWLPWGIVALIIFILPNLVFFPLVLPVVPIKQALPLFSFIRDKIGIKFPFKWEDQQMHRTTQDYADMLGWDELGAKVAAAYQSLSPAQKKQTIIFADNYGEAGAVHHFGKLYHLPDVVSLNSSFALWAPANINAKYMVYVEQPNSDNINGRLKPYLYAWHKTGQIDNPLAVEYAASVYIIEPKPALYKLYHDEWLKKQNE